MTQQELQYPDRSAFFAHKFVRLLQKSCAALDIGQGACLFLCYIAHTEDAARYSGPVRFWNEQLMTVMGFKSPKQLNEARSRAEDAGWLVYERSGNRQVGRYWVTIPDRFEGLDDTVIEDNHSVNHSESGTNSGMNSGMNKERIAERISDGKRNEKVTESGKPSIPSPDPDPNPIPRGEESLSAIAAPPAINTGWQRMILEAFDATFGTHSRLTPGRIKHLNARWKDAWWKENWQAALDRGGRSAFLRGANDRGWTIGLEFFLRPDTATNILEGKYDDRQPVGKPSRAQDRENANADAFAALRAAASGCQ